MDKAKLIYIKMRLQAEKQTLIDLLPQEFKARFDDEAYIAGNCIYSLWNSSEPKDFDFFLQTKEFVEELREYFLDTVGYHGRGISGGIYKDLPLLVTSNAISLGKYQIILQWCGTPKEVIGQFDFAHLQFSYHKAEIETFSDFKYLDTDYLHYNELRARDIVGSLHRTMKFVSRGMKINQKEMSKILLKLKEVGFSEREVKILQEAKERPESDHFGS